MLKETETEETIVFFVTFSLLVAFQSEGGLGPLATPMLYDRETSSQLPVTIHSSSYALLDDVIIFSRSDSVVCY